MDTEVKTTTPAQEEAKPEGTPTPTAETAKAEVKYTEADITKAKEEAVKVYQTKAAADAKKAAEQAANEKLPEPEKQAKALADAEKAREEAEAKLALRDRQDHARQSLSAKNLDTEAYEFVVGSTDQETDEKVAKFDALVTKIAQKQVDERLAGTARTPMSATTPAGGTTPAPAKKRGMQIKPQP